MKKVAIVGLGWVGKSMLDLFPDALVYSPGVILHDGNWIQTKEGDKSWIEWEENKSRKTSQKD